MIFHPERVIFLHSGKTAGTAIEYAFGYTNATHSPEDADLHVFKGWDAEHGLYLQHATARFMRERVAAEVWRDYLKLTVVRNPYDRLVSVYYFAERRYRERFGSFEGFVRALPRLLDEERPWHGSHLVPQYHYAYVDDERVADVVLRFETLDDDFGALCARLGRSMQLERVNTATSLSRPRIAAAQLYSPVARRIVQDLYCRDFESFEYGLEPPPATNNGAAPAELSVARANNMNCDEGHLGGYVRASRTPAPSGLRVDHGDPATYTPALWRWGYETLGVRSVLDLGCGEGHGARFFRELGCRVRGVDGSAQARRDSAIPDAHVTHDYTEGTYLPADGFDLVWCCEFVEHVEERCCANFLETFACSDRYVMMTYAPPGAVGWHHVNCQPAEYWIAKLATIGFRLDDGLTTASRAAAEPGHYRARGLCFVRA